MRILCMGCRYFLTKPLHEKVVRAVNINVLVTFVVSECDHWGHWVHPLRTKTVHQVVDVLNVLFKENVDLLKDHHSQSHTPGTMYVCRKCHTC